MYELTNPQKGIWLTEQYFQNTTINNICGSVTIKQDTDLNLLNTAINIFIQNNDSFKLRFKQDKTNLLQYFSKDENYNFEILTIDKESQIEEQSKKMVNTRFDLINSRVFDFKLFKLSSSFGGFIVNVHHIISDAATFSFIATEIVEIYSKLLKNETIPQKTYSYIDYINSEKEYLNSTRFGKDKNYWNEVLTPLPEVATIPSIGKVSSMNDYKSKREELSLDHNLVCKIKNYCTQNKISIFNFLIGIYSIYIGRINHMENFLLGTPILNRTNYAEKHTSGMFINTSLLKIDTSQNLTFTDFAKKIASNCMQMLRHQKYNYQHILDDIRKKDASVSNLYDVLLSYQVTQATDSSLSIPYSSKWYGTDFIANSLDIHFHDNDDTGNLLVEYDYRQNKYSSNDIQNLHNRILTIIDQVLENDKIYINDIDIITLSEKEELLTKFNDTNLEYDFTENIINLFEKQVKKTPNKTAVICNSKKLTYKELNEKANCLARELQVKGVKQEDIVGIMMNRSLEMIIGLIAILKCGSAYLPIDPEYPIERIAYMIENSETKLLLVNNYTEKQAPESCLKINVENIKKHSKENIGLKISENSLVYLIYTSGSTGKPKGVQVTNKNLNNFITGMKNLIDFTENKVLVSVTTICFDIFGLEMWCSLTSGLTLVVANETEQNNPALLNQLCLRNNVNIMQTTPSRYSVILEDTNNLAFLKNITEILVGGETLSEKILATMKKHSTARIFNMYGPTETTIWSTVKELTHSKTITIGKPIANTKCYILDKYHKLLPKNVVGGLYIGGNGVSNGYLKREDLNNEKFIQVPFAPNQKLYNTNDLAYFSEQGEIVHLGRDDFQVKIRGFRVELGEIEKAIEKNEQVKQAVVMKGKQKNEHDVLIAYYTVKNENPKLICDLKTSLSNELPQYMIPNYFVKLEKMPYTPNGKIDRNRLPEPDTYDIDKMIVIPRNELDEQLINMIGKILKVESISLTDNLLDLGGDSLAAITLSTKILSQFNVQVNIKDILSKFTIKDISDYIKANKPKNVKKIKIEKTPFREVYPLSSAQNRIYYHSQMIGENNLVYNLSGGILVDEILDKEKVKNVFEKIISRHSTLRTSFILSNNMVVQKIFDTIDFEIPVYQNSENEVTKIINTFAKPFNLEKAPLIRVALHYIDNHKTLMLIDTHHIIMDGTSLNNLIIEFNRIYNGENLKKIPIQYVDYAMWEMKYNESEGIKKHEDYWINKLKDSSTLQLNLPYDSMLSGKKSYQGSKISTILDESKFKKIENYAQKIGVSPYVLFLSAFFVLLYKYTGQEEIILGSPIANRNINETKRMIGMFVNNIVIRAKINSEETFKEFLDKIKEQILEDLSNQPYPFDTLVKKLDLKVDNSHNPLFDVMFTYQNEEKDGIKINHKKCQVIEIDNHISKFNMSLEIKPKTHTINLEYCTDLFKKQTMEDLLEHYLNTLNCVTEESTIKMKDVSILSEKEKNKILYKFNDTKMDYPKNKTISQLFEEQVEKKPNAIAVVFEDKKLTYQELNKKSNQLANYLRNSGIHPNDIIGIMLPRSFELLISILGILKSGACYIPIDPTFPEKRIDYMLDNSQAKLVITTNKLYDNIKFSNKIDIKSKEIALQNDQNLENVNLPEDMSYIIYTSGSTGLPKGVMLKHKSLSNLCTYLNNEVEFLKEECEFKNIVSVTTASFDIFLFETIICLQKGLKIILANEEEQRIPSLLDKLIKKNDVQIIQMTPSRMQILIDNKEDVPSLSNLKYVILAGEALPLKLRDELIKIGIKKVYNGYGPSETTVFSTFTDVTNRKEINIGVPLGNTQVYILDHNLKMVPIGIAGELYIAGDGVGKGYLNREDLTKERYLKNPFLENSVMYKTGDMVKFTDKGELTYLGRIDNQIKIRGLRIELEEIENKILEFPCIKKAKVMKQVIGSREIISAYYVSTKRIRTSELRNYLQDILPNYMIPSYFTALDAFPYTPNGKIDKNALPIPDGILQNEKARYIAPVTDLEVKLVSIWEEVLNTKPIGIHDNFFELGGDSILAMNLNIRLLKITDKIKYSDIFAYPTITDLARKIQSEIEENKEEDLSNLNEKYKEIFDKNMNLPQKKVYHPLNNVLLTGVTGYLGIHILEGFLKNEQGKIYVLVRKDPGSTVKEKLLGKMHYYFEDKYDKYIDDRIVIVEGDIAKDGFGLNQEDLLNLGNSVNSIINSAAKVSHYGRYAEFYNTNVKSVEKIIDFANVFHKKFYHISTLSVSGNGFVDQYYMEQELKEDIDFCENNLYIGQKLDNVYIRSKFEAEKRILNAILKGTDAYILRLGNLMPRLSDGKFQENIDENAYMNRLKTFMHLGYIPDYLMNGYLEFTPIDSTVQSILKIMQFSNNENRIYHVFNHNHVFIKDLLKILDSIDIHINVIKSEDFKKNIKTILNSPNSNLLNTLINDLDKDLNLHYDSNIKLNSKHSVKLLELYGFKWPIINKQYIINILKLIKGE